MFELKSYGILRRNICWGTNTKRYFILANSPHYLILWRSEKLHINYCRTVSLYRISFSIMPLGWQVHGKSAGNWIIRYGSKATAEATSNIYSSGGCACWCCIYYQHTSKTKMGSSVVKVYLSLLEGIKGVGLQEDVSWATISKKILLFELRLLIYSERKWGC